MENEEDRGDQQRADAKEVGCVVQRSAEHDGDDGGGWKRWSETGRRSFPGTGRRGTRFIR